MALFCRRVRFSRNLPSVYYNWKAAGIPEDASKCRRNYCSAREIPVQVESKEPPKPSNSPNTSQSSFNKEEIQKFDALAGEWWIKDGPHKALHSLNTLRVTLIRDGIIATGGTADAEARGSRPLKGFSILDVGCGGGILTEPLARLGASVTGLDASKGSIEAAEHHAEKDPKLQDCLQYVCGDLDSFSMAPENQNFDAVVASEVLEHVDCVESFVSSCCKCIKPGGSLFLTTINKTPQSFLGAIVAAEYLLGIVPRGTHSWGRFVRIEDLKSTLSKNGFHVRLQHGMFYTPGLDTWCWTVDTSVNYALHAVKA